MSPFSLGFARARVEAIPYDPKSPGSRELLRQAQATAAAASDAAQAAAQASARGQVAVDRARAGFALHDALDGQIAAHRADLLRAGEDAGWVALPPELAELRRVKGVAGQDLADAAAAHLLLATEARAAAVAAEQAADAVRKAADAVAGEIALGLVAELREIEAEAGRLRVVLAGYIGGRTVSEAPPPWAISQLVHEGQHAALCDLANPNWPAASAEWIAFRRELTKNADAAFGAAP